MVKAEGFEVAGRNAVSSVLRFCVMLGTIRLGDARCSAGPSFWLLRSCVDENLRVRCSLVLHLPASFPCWPFETEYTSLVCACMCVGHAGLLDHGCSRRITPRLPLPENGVLGNLAETSCGPALSSPHTLRIQPKLLIPSQIKLLKTWHSYPPSITTIEVGTHHSKSRRGLARDQRHPEKDLAI